MQSLSHVPLADNILLSDFVLHSLTPLILFHPGSGSGEIVCKSTSKSIQTNQRSKGRGSARPIQSKNIYLYLSPFVLLFPILLFRFVSFRSSPNISLSFYYYKAKLARSAKETARGNRNQFIVFNESSWRS